MAQNSAASQGRFQRAKVLLLGAADSGALAVVALGSAGTANASCASFSGINSGTGVGKCQTTSFGDTAIGISNPGYNPAFSGTTPTIAVATGTGNRAVALGNGSAAGAGCVLNYAMVIGKGSTALADGHGSLN